MQNWKLVKAKYRKVNEDGKEANVTEPYLVDALSATEAEARLTEHLEQCISGDFNITGITNSKLEPSSKTEGEWPWEVKILSLDVDEKTGKERKLATTHLVWADDAEESLRHIAIELDDMLIDWEVIGLKRSPIVDVLPYEAPKEEGESDGEAE